VPIANAHSSANSHGNTERNANPYGDTYTDANANFDSITTDTYAHCNKYTNSNANSDFNSNTNADPDCDSHRNAYPHAGPDHTQRAWLQSAGWTNGGPLMDRSDFKQHRYLPRRCVDRYGPEQRFLH
jgi:hypothetical protein